MRLQTELCIALGIPVRVMEPMDVYLTGGRIIQDADLSRRAESLIVGSVMPAGARLKIIEAMTPAERRDLRERVER
jgi:hypothetical protein